MGSWLNSAIPWYQIAPMVNKSCTANNTSTTDNQNEEKVELKQVCLNCGITIDEKKLKLTFQTGEKKKITLETVKLKFPVVPKQFIDYLSNEKAKSKIILPLTYKSIDLETTPLPICTSIWDHYSNKHNHIQNLPSTSQCSQTFIEEPSTINNLSCISNPLTININLPAPEERKNHNKRSKLLLKFFKFNF